jgi:hypothetical protein
VTSLAGTLRAVTLVGPARVFARLAHLVLLFCREFCLHGEDQRLLCLRGELMLEEQRPRGGQVGCRVRTRLRSPSSAP